MELRLHHIIDHLYNIFLENDGTGNCAQLIEEDFNKIIDMNDENNCNVVSMNSLNIQNANNVCTSHDNDVSYKNVKFCGEIGSAHTHQKGKIDFLRSINI